MHPVSTKSSLLGSRNEGIVEVHWYLKQYCYIESCCFMSMTTFSMILFTWLYAKAQQRKIHLRVLNCMYWIAFAMVLYAALDKTFESPPLGRCKRCSVSASLSNYYIHTNNQIKFTSLWSSQGHLQLNCRYQGQLWLPYMKTMFGIPKVTLLSCIVYIYV